METHLLEINLISAQGLKPPSANLRRLQTYAVASINSTTKLRTRIDRLGGENPTWNDKFFFRVAPGFISSDTSAVSVEIYALGCLKDPLIGTVRFLIGNCLSGASSPTAAVGVPSFIALQIRRSSGRFEGVLNLGAMLINGSDFAALTGISAIGYRDLMGKKCLRHRRRCGARTRQTEKSKENYGDSCENSCGDSGEFSDADSSASSKSATSTVLKDWNGIREMAGKEEKGLDNGGLLCGLGFQRKIHSSPFDQNLQISTTTDGNENRVYGRSRSLFPHRR